MDLQLPGMSGIETTRAIVATLQVADRAQTMVRAREAGLGT